MNNLKENIICNKSIVISNKEGESQTVYGSAGQLRFNQTTLKFEGYHSYPNSNTGADIFGNNWRKLTQDVASTSNLGIIRVGSNLNMQATTGILSSVAAGVSRIYQCVITVSPIDGAADYQSINEAISHAIGSPLDNPPYTYGVITSNIGGTGIVSPPSPTYPFIILLSPGQYSETTNKITLPDYVSLRGENNYNSVITQNSGDNLIEDSSMIIVGENCEIKNLVINLNDSSESYISNAIYAFNKSNVVIDNCIITCSNTINTTQETYGIYIDSGYNNSITNNKFIFNSLNLLGTLTSIYTANTTPRFINNNINMLTQNTNVTCGIELFRCLGTESINDKVYIENLVLTNNNYNTINNGDNIGIYSLDSSIIIKNSDIEVSNNNNNNYYNCFGISINNVIPYDVPPYSDIASNVLIFTNLHTNPSQNTINSSNISVINFLTQNYEKGQYISILGSSFNDGVYKISSVPTSNIMILENGYNLVNEDTTLDTTNITLRGLYDINIYNTHINSSGNTINNINGVNNYILNLNNVVNEGGSYNISPSYVVYTNYKTITIGQINCDYNSLYNAMNSINDNSSNTRYLIKIQSGIYYESTYILCKEYVDIEGNGVDNTIINFAQSDNTDGTPTLDTSCFIICSNISIKNLTIKNIINEFTSEFIPITTTILYNPLSINNIILENLVINADCNNTNIYGIYFVNGSKIILRNIDLIIHGTSTGKNNYGIYNENCSECNFYNISNIVDSFETNNNYSIYLYDSECNIYNSTLIANSGTQLNAGIYTQNSNNVQKLIQIYNGQIRASNSVDYSIYTDNYYTIICNGAQLLGDTFANSLSSYIYCNSCYTFTDENDKTNIQSLNSRGQNEQSALTYSTLTIGDTAGKRNATGTNNVFIGVNSGSNVTSASYNTFLGYNTGKTLNDANYNTLIGSNVGQSITTGTDNTITGSEAGKNLTTGNTNTITGTYAGNQLSTGFGNTLNGTSSGLILTTGFRNTFMGDGSGLSSNIAIFNTFIGSLSGYDNNNGNNNTYLGYQSGYEGISSNNNVLIGTSSGYTNQSSNIVAVGTNAGYMNTSSIKNTYIGHQSGYNNLTGDCNTYLGHNAGSSNTSSIILANSSGAYNIAIGNEAGYSITSGSRNVLIGSTKSGNGTSNDSAGWSLQDGTDNIHIGANAGAKATSTINNVLIGSDVGTSITTAGNNVLIGKNTGNTINTLGANIIIGSDSGTTTTSGSAMIIGQNAGVGYTGQYAYTLGNNAGKNILGDYNMFVGYNSGGGPSTLSKIGNYNLAIGPYSGYVLSTGSRNVLIGSGGELNSVGSKISTGSDNTILGYSAGSQIQGGNNNTLIGSNAGANLTVGANNLILGYNSAYKLNAGSNNVSLGPYSGYNLDTGSGNIFSGYQAGYNTTDGSYNINIGYQTGYLGNSITYSNNIHIGYQSGYNSTAANNLFLGYKAGLRNSTGANNIFIGLNSGQGNNTNNSQIGENNLFIGTNTGQSNYDGYNNIFFGSNAGIYNTNGSKNIFIGENTGMNTSLSRNIFIGTSTENNKGVGYNSRIDQNTLTGGDFNLFVGHDVGIENTTGTGNIFFGDHAGQNNTTGSQNIYLGTYAGNVGNTDTADNNIAIGYYAGYSNTIGQENILIGKEAGKVLNESNQIFIGTGAGASTTTGNNNIFIGKSAGEQIVTDVRNVVIGYNAMSKGKASDCVIIGNEAGNTNNGIDNVFIGNLSGQLNNLGLGNTFIGSATGGNNNTGSGNIFMGTASGITNTSGSLNTFMGFTSGINNTDGNRNIFMGYQTGYLNQTGSDNIFIGTESGYNSNSTNFNTFIGNFSGYNNYQGQANLYMGYESGNSSTHGNYNICLGYQTGYYNQSSFNTFIGLKTGYNTDATNNGYYGNNEYNTYIGNLVGQLNNGYNNFFLGYEKVDNTSSTGSITTYNDKFAIYNNSQSGITSNTSGTCKILIGGDFTTGTVGIGTLIPDTYGTISETAVRLVVVGKVKANSYIPFTGSHEVNIDSSISNPQEELIEGMIMTSTGIVTYQDINNTLVTVKPSNTVNDKAVYGVYSGNETVIDNESNISITTYYLNSLGEGGILVSNYGGEIQNGDYITTCPISISSGGGGYGSLQSDDILHSYTVAKCTQNVDWSSISNTITYNNVSYKYTMVSCTYHCG